MDLFPHQRLKQQLLRCILDGYFGESRKLPRIQDLASTFDVSTKTVQKAIHALAEDGIIEAKRGVGLMIRNVPLASGRSKQVVLLHAGNPDYVKSMPWPGQVVEKFRQQLERAGYQVSTVCLADDNRLSLLQSLNQKKIAGVALMEIDNDGIILDLRDMRIPLVSMDYDAYRHGVSSVVFDNTYGSFLATKHLISMGHRNIIFMRPLVRTFMIRKRSLDASEEGRLTGYSIAMKDAGLEDIVQEYEPNKPNRDLLEELMGRKARPTAFVMPGEGWALRIASILNEMNLRIPSDVSIIGFGGSRVEFAPGQKLSTVDCDYPRMGASAAKLLIAALTEGATAPQRLINPVKLVPLNSTGPVPALAVH